jgi:alkaline phosphatase D
MMAKVDVTNGPAEEYSMDQWPGYEFERRRMLTHFREHKTSNPVVLTGDIHCNWANELLSDFARPESRPVGVEFVGTSISSGGDGEEMPKSRAKAPEENPCVKFLNAERGYVRCEVTPGRWQTDYRTVPFVTKPGAPLQTRASYVVESGQPRLQRV